MIMEVAIMRNSVIATYVMIIGAILMCLGLIYLKAQSVTTNNLIEKVSDDVADGKDSVYQQQSNADRSLVSDEELYAMIMGYRDCPIIIDGNEIDPDGDDLGTYITYIKDGVYLKKYSYDANHDIEKISFTYNGT